MFKAWTEAQKSNHVKITDVMCTEKHILVQKLFTNGIATTNQSRKALNGEKRHKLSGKEKVPGSKVHANSVQGHDCCWFPWKRFHCKQYFLLPTPAGNSPYLLNDHCVLVVFMHHVTLLLKSYKNTIAFDICYIKYIVARKGQNLVLQIKQEDKWNI